MKSRWTQGMPATFRWNMFCFPVCFPKL